MTIKDDKDLKKFRLRQTNKENGNKNMSFRRLLNSFKFSFDGLIYAYTNEQSMFIHISITLVTVLGGIYFDISRMEWLFVMMMIGLVVAAELINTAIEATIDLLTDKFHPLAKIAKDTGSAAVLALSTVAFVGAAIIFIPCIITKWF